MAATKLPSIVWLEAGRGNCRAGVCRIAPAPRFGRWHGAARARRSSRAEKRSGRNARNCQCDRCSVRQSDGGGRDQVDSRIRATLKGSHLLRRPVRWSRAMRRSGDRRHQPGCRSRPTLGLNRHVLSSLAKRGQPWPGENGRHHSHRSDRTGGEPAPSFNQAGTKAKLMADSDLEIAARARLTISAASCTLVESGFSMNTWQPAWSASIVRR